MKILRHHLCTDAGERLPLVRSPNTGDRLQPKYLVIHYTAGGSAEASVNWLTNPSARASAHLVIGRDGGVTQLVPFDRVAWHAGVSEWEGLTGLNHHSIGIELDNAGRLEAKGGQWTAWFGRTYPREEVMEATHRHESAASAWHVYTEAQIEATLEAARVIIEKYGLIDVVGHDDISPGRKVDPGPAFPLGSLRARLLGRADDHLPVFETTAALNIRHGPGTSHERLPASPLRAGTRLVIHDRQGAWRRVSRIDGIGDELEIEGWVHGNWVRRLD